MNDVVNEAHRSSEQAHEQQLLDSKHQDNGRSHTDAANAPIVPMNAIAYNDDSVGKAHAEEQCDASNIFPENASLGELAQRSESELCALWSQIGLSEEEKKQELCIVRRAVADLYRMHVNVEVQARDGILANVKELQMDIETIANVVQVEPKVMPPMQNYTGRGGGGRGPTLMQQLEWLRSYKTELETIKDSLIDRALPFLEKLHRVWSELRLPFEDAYTEPCLEGVINEERVLDCQERLKHFEYEKHVRFAETKATLQHAHSLMLELEFTPQTAFDTLVSGGDVNAMALDEVSMCALAQRAKELEDIKAARTETIKDLGTKIQPLWTRLKVSQDARRQFFAENSGLSERVIDSCTREYNRLCDLKQEMLASLVEDARLRIKQLWEYVRVGPTERACFEPWMNASGSDMTEALLTRHDEEIAALAVRFSVLEPILGYVNKYLTLCEERTSYDILIQDSSRLLSRQRGASAKSEAEMRKRVESDLPKVIKKLKQSVAVYEESNGPFKYKDQHFLTYLSESEAEYITRKKEERDAKLKAKRERNEEEMMNSQGGGGGGRHISRATPSKSKAGGRNGSRAPLGRNNNNATAKSDGPTWPLNAGEN